MDLKSRLLALGLEDAIVSKILPIIRPDEAEYFYNATDEDIKKKIPELLERIINKEESNHELDVNSIGLKSLGKQDPSTLTSPTQSVNLTPPKLDGAPKLVEPNYLQSPKLKGLLFLFIVFALFISGSAYFLASFTKSSKQDKSEPAIVKGKPAKPPIQKQVPTLKPVDIPNEIPRPPDFRGAWMFMPWDSYEPSIICDDGRLKDLNDKYTIQFWLKMTKSIPTKANILEFISGKNQLETIYLNEYGHICFKAGVNYPTLALLKKIPDNGRHFHISVTRDSDICRLYVNGRLRKEQQLVLIPDQNQLAKYFIILLRSKSTLKGIALDELMVSNEILFEKNFRPERILTISESTVLYIPFEKTGKQSIPCYGNKNYREYPLSGGKWLNVQNEVQQIINQLEFEETKGQQSSSSEP